MFGFIQVADRDMSFEDNEPGATMGLRRTPTDSHRTPRTGSAGIDQA